MEHKKSDKPLALALVAFWLLVGAYFVAQRYLTLENAGEESTISMIAVTPEKINRKTLNTDVLERPAFKELSPSPVRRPQAEAGAGNRSPFAVSERKQ